MVRLERRKRQCYDTLHSRRSILRTSVFRLMVFAEPSVYGAKSLRPELKYIGATMGNNLSFVIGPEVPYE